MLLLAPYYFSTMSTSPSMTSPWISICSFSLGFLVTDAPHANFLPNTLAASPSLTPNASSPVMVVTCFRLLRVYVSITISAAAAFFLPGYKHTLFMVCCQLVATFTSLLCNKSNVY